MRVRSSVESIVLVYIFDTAPKVSDMESLRVLRQLVTLAEIGRYRKASEKLGITHSALSQAIKRIEDYYGVPVFARCDGRIQPTEYGALLVRTAKETLSSFEKAERHIQLLKNFEIGHLTIGADPNLADGLVSDALGRLTAKFPKLKYTLRMRLWTEMQADLRSRDLDIYVGLPPDEREHGIRMEEFTLPPPVAVCRTGHPLTTSSSLSIMDTLEYPVASGDAPDWMLKDIAAWFPQNRAPTMWRLRDLFLLTYDLSVLPSIIVNSDALAVLPIKVIETELYAGRAIILTFPDANPPKPATGVIATRDHMVLPPAAQVFRTEVYRGLGLEVPPLERGR